MRPTTEEADLLVSAPKIIRQSVTWAPIKQSKIPRWRFEVVVVCPHPRVDLRLVGSYGTKNWGLSLLMDMHPIRRTGNHTAEHRNPDGAIVAAPHKHRWDTDQGDRDAYIPTDIDFGNVNHAFFDFLDECNIRLEGDYQYLMTLGT